MRQFFSAFWQGVTATKNATGNILFLLIIAFIVVSLVSTDVTSVEERSALVVNPSGVIVEQKSVVDPVGQFLSGYQDQERETLLRDLIKAIDTAAEDDRITALALDLTNLQAASLSTLEDFASAVRDFRTSGKPVIAFGNTYSQSQYYVAAHADEVYLNSEAFSPLGGVFFTGLGIYPTYFKSALDKLKVRYHVFKAGLYKGYVEPYTRDSMSAESREANTGLLDSLWGEFRAAILRERVINAETFTRYTNQYDLLLDENGGDANAVALDNGLVDGLITREAFRERMVELTEKQEETFRQINFRNYLVASGAALPVINPTSDKIAVITAKGTILDGQQPPGTVGSETLSELIRTARNDDSIKAVVIRIDSPGGSASAAEMIRHELELTQKAGKPVVASMGGAAASGGYWIAATSNKIFARATTMTGSIGAFMMFPTFNESLSELGINTDGVGTTSLSNAFDASLPINPVLQKTLQHSIGQTYNRFIGVVAEGREMTPEAVDKVAQGRVWTGATAVELGLVDSIGDVDDAIDSAAMLASVSHYDVLHMEQELSAREQLMQQILGSSLRTIHAAMDGLMMNQYQALYQTFYTNGLHKLPPLPLLNQGNGPAVYSQCLYCRVSF